MPDHNAATREQWLALRKLGLGGSDISAVVGLNPYRTPLQVYREKVGPPMRERVTPAMALGTWVEPVLEALYCLVFARRAGLEHPGLLIHRQEDWRRGTPDGLDPEAQRGVDYKYTHRRNAQRWGLPGTDAVPAEYLTQVHWYMDLTGYRTWDLALVVGGEEELAAFALRGLIEGLTPEAWQELRRALDFRIYPVRYDPEFLALLVEEGRRFWQDYVLPRKRPPFEGTTDARDFLAARYPAVTAPVRPATPEEVSWVAAYAEADLEEEAWKAERLRLEVLLKDAIGSALGLTAPGLQAVWSGVSGHPVVDWKGVALAAGATPEVIAAHTVWLPESRRFQVAPRRR